MENRKILNLAACIVASSVLGAAKGGGGDIIPPNFHGIRQEIKVDRGALDGVFGTDYEVQSGDSLESIARKVLGDASRWQEIASANRIKEPYTIQPGRVLKVPEKKPESSPDTMRHFYVWPDPLFGDRPYPLVPGALLTGLRYQFEIVAVPGNRLSDFEKIVALPVKDRMKRVDEETWIARSGRIHVERNAHDSDPTYRLLTTLTLKAVEGATLKVDRTDQRFDRSGREVQGSVGSRVERGLLLLALGILGSGALFFLRFRRERAQRTNPISVQS